jgi:hypothetical protein
MRGDDKRVVEAFRRYLTEQGWIARTEVNFADVYAERSDERLYAEVKGRTTEPGLDVDTLYGQLLRRMPEEEVGLARFAVVVPAEALSKAQRVSQRVRELLNIDLYAVSDDNRVRQED